MDMKINWFLSIYVLKKKKKLYEINNNIQLNIWLIRGVVWWRAVLIILLYNRRLTSLKRLKQTRLGVFFFPWHIVFALVEFLSNTLNYEYTWKLYTVIFYSILVMVELFFFSVGFSNFLENRPISKVSLFTLVTQ